MDRDGKPAAPELMPPARPHGSTAAEKPARCKGCGGYHGSVNLHRLCLEAAIDALLSHVHRLEGKGNT